MNGDLRDFEDCHTGKTVVDREKLPKKPMMIIILTKLT